MKVIITGADGRLGRLLVERLRSDYRVIGLGKQQLDVSDFNAVKAVIAAERPDMVLHTAAWTDVDGCAREPQKALVINGMGAHHVSVAAASIHATVVHISTNEVFDGDTKRPYLEYDSTRPINPYGYSKWYGERAVIQTNPKHIIVRTAWLFAHGGRNFVQAILNAARDGRPLRVVTDEVANPTYTHDLVAAIVALIQTERYGIYHCVNEGFCSRYQFARYILDKAGYAHIPIEPITRYQWPRPSSPPPYSALENAAAKHLGIQLRPWQAAVDAFLAQEGWLA